MPGPSQACALHVLLCAQAVFSQIQLIFELSEDSLDRGGQTRGPSCLLVGSTEFWEPWRGRLQWILLGDGHLSGPGESVTGPELHLCFSISVRSAGRIPLQALLVSCVCISAELLYRKGVQGMQSSYTLGASWQVSCEDIQVRMS